MTDGTASGKVYLVGAGPGDPDLLTVKAHRLLGEADVILHDSLVPEDLLAVVPDETRTVNVGKRADGDGPTTQREINERLVAHAQEGKVVVRLKGGDPTVYGRGGEESQYLAAAGVPFELVPGVSSLTAGPGVVGIPLTHRDHASSLTVITGHEAAKEESALDWDGLGMMLRRGGTLVILMGVRTLPRSVERLTAAGVSPDTPVAMVERATWQDEDLVTGTLETIVDDAEHAGITPPAITVVGDVVSVREEVAEALARDVSHASESPEHYISDAAMEYAPVLSPQ